MRLAARGKLEFARFFKYLLDVVKPMKTLTAMKTQRIEQNVLYSFWPNGYPNTKGDNLFVKEL